MRVFRLFIGKDSDEQLTDIPGAFSFNATVFELGTVTQAVTSTDVMDAVEN